MYVNMDVTIKKKAVKEREGKGEKLRRRKWVDPNRNKAKSSKEQTKDKINIEKDDVTWEERRIKIKQDKKLRRELIRLLFSRRFQCCITCIV